MGGESRTQPAMRERVTHRHVPVYVLPKDIMRTATATLTTCPATPAICYGHFFRAIPIYPALYRQGYNSLTEIERTSLRRANTIFPTTRKDHATRARLACNQIAFETLPSKFFIVNVAPVRLYSNFS